LIFHKQENRISSLFVCLSTTDSHICHTDAPRLHIYLDKNTPQDKPDPIYHEDYRYFILCSTCVPRCAGLINQEKGETIKREFIEQMMDEGFNVQQSISLATLKNYE
jgi:predicted molibdopterin-dependent oxidoreductase YjgC